MIELWLGVCSRRFRTTSCEGGQRQNEERKKSQRFSLFSQRANWVCQNDAKDSRPASKNQESGQHNAQETLTRPFSTINE